MSEPGRLKPLDDETTPSAFHPNRRFKRTPVLVEIEVRELDDEETPLPFDAIDLSEGGAFIRSDYLLDVGGRLKVSFKLEPSSPRIESHARVVWATQRSSLKGQPGMAIAFEDLDDGTRKQLKNFVRNKD